MNFVPRLFREIRVGQEFCFPKDEQAHFQKIERRQSRDRKRDVNAIGSNSPSHGTELMCGNNDTILLIDRA